MLLIFCFIIGASKWFLTTALISSFNLSNFESSAHLSCLKYITDSFVWRSTIVVFEEEIDQIPWIDTLLRSIGKPKIILGKGNPMDLYGFYILFPEFGTSYVGRFCSRNHVESKFLLVWTEPVRQQYIVKVFEQFWRDRRMNVVALSKQKHGHDLKFHSFSPFTEDKCGSVGRPVLINVWNRTTGEFILPSNLFANEKLNFKGCSLNVITNNQPPDSFVRFDGKYGQWRAAGVGNKILKVAEKYFNFTSIISTSDLYVNLNHTWYYSSQELNRICDAVNNEQADLAIGWYSYASIEMDNLDSRVELGRVSSIDCFGWAVPYRAGARPPNLSYFTEEFEPRTWCLILVTFVVACIMFYCIMRRNLLLSNLLVFQTLLEQPVVVNSAQLRQTSFRILFANFCFYSLVVAAAYRASFASFITVSFQGREFTSVSDILESSLQIYGSPEMLKVLKVTAAETNSGAKVLSRFHLLPPGDYTEVMKRVIRRRDIAVLGVKRSLYYYSVSEAKRIKVKIPFRFIPGCLIRPHSTHFLFKRGSYLARPFNVLLNRLFESGIIPHWILHLGSNKVLPTEKFKGRTLRLCFLKEPLYFLAGGYVLSILVFSAEVFLSTGYARCSHHREFFCPGCTQRG